MGSPITFSGFNQIDFSVVLTAVMQQESRPLVALQQQQQSLQTADTTYASLVTKLTTLRSSAADLAGKSTVVSNAATSSDAQSVAAAATTGAVEGRYEVVVSTLARAQVMASATSSPDTATTTVATGGNLTIGGISVPVNGAVTLQGLADAINGTSGIPVFASIIETSPGAFRLVLTANGIGTANGFTVTNALTGTTLAFTDTDHDGASGNTAADNAVQATDASLTINNIQVTSASNTLTSAIPGVTLTLSKEDPANTIVVDVTRDDAALSDRVQAFVTAYNDLAQFTTSTLSSPGSLAHSSMVRGLRNQLRTILTAAHGSDTFTRLAEVGVGFSRTGQLTFDAAALKEGLQTDAGAVANLFADTQTGAFAATKDLIQQYTDTDGLVPLARRQLTQQIAQMGVRIDELQRRLALRRDALQREYTAADQAMTRLNSQSGSISSLANNLTTNQV